MKWIDGVNFRWTDIKQYIVHQPAPKSKPIPAPQVVRVCNQHIHEEEFSVTHPVKNNSK
jgi:hypothetical protein